MESVDGSTMNAAELSPPIPLEYGRSSRFADATRNVRAGLLERIHGVAYLVGILLAAAGGARQAAWALGLTFALGGLGTCLAGGYFSSGAAWMAFGGLLIGLAFPLPHSNRKE